MLCSQIKPKSYHQLKKKNTNNQLKFGHDLNWIKLGFVRTHIPHYRRSPVQEFVRPSQRAPPAQAQPTRVAPGDFVKRRDRGHTSGAGPERDARTAHRLKDVKAAPDMLDQRDLPAQSQHPPRQQGSPVFLHAVSRSSTGREEDIGLKTLICPLSIVFISFVLS